MKKKILGIVFVILSLLFISACSNNSSSQTSNELDGEYFQTTNDYDNELSDSVAITINENGMVGLSASMLMTGYQYDNDSLEVFKSHADNVYQIVFTVSKSETDRLSFAGNYVPATHQIELTSMKGTPTRSTVKMEERTFYD